MTEELIGHHIGEWLIVEYIGAGKSALVFKAESKGLISALKVFDPELIERYGAEAQKARIERELILKGANHANIVDIYDGGTCSKSGYYYVAMAYIDAPNLASVLKDVPRERIWPLIEQVASAAKFLEERGLAHRDIKPDNIVVSPNFQKATLLDLGVIKPIGVSGLTDDDQRYFIGTLQYSSPEFLYRTEEDTVDGWRALTFYQIGAVLHDLIMGRRIFTEYLNPFANLVHAVTYIQPHIEAHEVPADLILLAKNCLIKEPEKRLKFTEWDDFSVRTVDMSSANDAKERIRKRMGVARVQSEATSVSDETEKARVRKALAKVQTIIREMIEDECISSSYFPPLQMHECQTHSYNITEIVVFFKASPLHHLSNALQLVFRLSLVDVSANAIQLEKAAALCKSRLNDSQLEAMVHRTVFEGVFEDIVVRRIVAESLLLALDQAQQVSENSQATDLIEPLPLEVEEGSNE